MDLEEDRKRGKKTPTPEYPFEYVLLKYREKFGLSWCELMETPIKVLYQDLKMLEIEENVSKWRANIEDNDSTIKR